MLPSFLVNGKFLPLAFADLFARIPRPEWRFIQGLEIHSSQNAVIFSNRNAVLRSGCTRLWCHMDTKRMVIGVVSELFREFVITSGKCQSLIVSTCDKENSDVAIVGE